MPFLTGTLAFRQWQCDKHVEIKHRVHSDLSRRGKSWHWDVKLVLHALTSRIQSLRFWFLQHLNLQYVLCHAILYSFVCADCPLLAVSFKYSEKITFRSSLCSLCYLSVGFEQRAWVTSVPLHRYRLAGETQAQVRWFCRESEELTKWTELDE